MKTSQEKASRAFYSYVFNDYDNFISPLQQYMSNSFTDDKSQEIEVQNAICKMLGAEIGKHIYTLPEIKQNFVKSVKLLSKQNLDNIEFNEKFKDRTDKLKMQVKLHYMLDDIRQYNYELQHAAYLMAIYLKFVGFEREPNGKLNRYNEITKLPQIKKGMIYKYLESALPQSNFSLRLTQLNQLPQRDLINSLYNSMALFDYVTDQSTVGRYLSAEEKSKLPHVLDLIDDYASYEEFAEIIDCDFQNRLHVEMHTLENGMIF